MNSMYTRDMTFLVTHGHCYLRDTQTYLQYQTVPEGRENVCMSVDGI